MGKRSTFVVTALAAAAAFSAGRLGAQAPTQQKPAAVSSARLTSELENETTHVWKMHLPPRQTSSAHRHNHPRVIVPLSGGAVKIVKKLGPPQVVRWESGKAYWIPADQPGDHHSYTNESDRPIEFMYVEFEMSR